MSLRPAFAVAFLLALGVLTACQSEPEAKVGTTPPDAVSAGTVKINIEETGLYRVPAAELVEAGVPADQLRQEALALFLGNEVTPIWIRGSSLFFYGQAPTGRYSTQTAYVLRWSQAGQEGLSMRSERLPHAIRPAAAAVRQIRRVEQNRLYISQAASSVAEPWFWQRLAPGPGVQLPFALPYAVADEGEIRMALWGLTSDSTASPDHRVEVGLNGRSLGVVEWDGESAVTATLVVSAGVLREGENHLMASVPADSADHVDLSYLDWFEVGYQGTAQLRDGMLTLPDVSGDLSIENAALIFDVTDPSDPVFLSAPESAGGLEFHLDSPRSLVALSADGGLLPDSIIAHRSTDLTAASLGADYVIIAPEALIPALGPLVAARNGGGLTAEVFALEDIYDRFSAGAETPLALRAFLQHASAEWPLPHPRYLLLVGDATYDFHDYLGLSPQLELPPMLAPASHSGETVSDSRLVDLDEDGSPDLAVGRWPVSTSEMVTALIDRTLTYESAVERQSRSIFAVDDTDDSFVRLSDRLVQVAALDASALTLSGVPAAELMDAWNQGAWLINYVGHGSLTVWGRTELLSPMALEKLDGSHRPPIVVHLTCLTGYFAHPTQSCLAEELLWHRNGPVAQIAATSLTLSAHQEPFAVALIESLADPSVSTVGDALLLAQQTPGIDQEVIDTFVLLGDPALHIARPD